MSRKDGQLRFINYFAYGMTDFIGAGAFALTGAWLLYFYTTFCGLSALQASSIFAIARIVDAVASPTMGFITDNFHKTALGRRFGRRKFFLLAAIPLVIVYTFMWKSGLTYWYYVATYIGFEIVYTMVLIPYDTLAAEMTSDYAVRAKLTSARMYIAQFSAFLAAFLPGRLINALGKEDPNSFLYAGMAFTGIFMVVLVLVYTFTWERPLEEVEALEARHPKENLTLFQSIQKIFIDLGTTLRIRTFRAHLGMYLGGYLAQDTFNSVFTYFIVFALLKGAVVASNLMASMYIFQMVGVGIASYITIKLSPGASFRVVSLLFMTAILGFLLVYGVVPGSMAALFAVAAVAGFGRGGINFIPWNNYTFVPDVDEVVSADRREGVFAGFMCFIRKASQALAVFLVGLTLQKFNFRSGPGITSQPQEALTAMVVILVAVPAMFLIIGIISSFKFKINGKSHAILKQEVERLKNGGSKADVTPETRKILEELTGWSYEALWGNNPIGYKNWRKFKDQAKNKKGNVA